MNTAKNLKEAETSPDGRYVRFDEKLGSGAYKEVFLSYDTETGKEVAWNTVSLARLPENEKRRIRMETEILKELNHPHIINFYTVWDNVEKEQICFTTEIVTSGTLKQYVNRVRSVKLKVIKKWCRQILTALEYLHCHQPPIIHRDLKCDNIFINGSTGEIRIGDFGLSAARHTTHVESVLGTPEFMAPELYDENYNEKVDLYSFGMAVLEMVTKEYPYEECIAEGTMVNLACGGARRIEHVMPGSLVLSYDGKTGGLVARTVTKRINNGRRECIELQFKDGRKLLCTSDHRILTSVGEWVEADQLKVGQSEVAVGPQFTCPFINSEEEDEQATPWQLDLRTSLGCVLRLSDGAEKERALAFARLLGYATTQQHSNGSQHAHPDDGDDDSGVRFTNALDAEACVHDIHLLTGSKPSVRKNGRSHVVPPPSHLRHAWAAVAPQPSACSGIVAPLPPFLACPTCPLALVREYVGGVFGAAVSSHSHSSTSPSTSLPHCTPTHLAHREDVFITLSWWSEGSTARQHMQLLLQQFYPLLQRCQIDTRNLHLTLEDEQHRLQQDGDVLHPTQWYAIRLSFDSSSNSSPSSSPLDFRYCSSRRGVNAANAPLPLHAALLVNKRSVGIKQVFDLSVPTPQQPDDPSFMAAGIVVHNCIVAGTPVALSDGRSVPIEHVHAGDEVLGRAMVDGHHGFATRSVEAVLNRGVRECVELLCDDGRTITCTADHRFLSADDKWMKAADMMIGETMLHAGVEYPFDPHTHSPSEQENAWQLDTGIDSIGVLNMQHRRAHSLALARLLGYMMSCNSEMNETSARMYLSHVMDVAAMQKDIHLVTGSCGVAAKDESESVTHLSLPTSLHRVALNLGMPSDDGVFTLPSFMMDEQCPIIIVREFLAGLFGGNGCAPSLRYLRDGTAALQPIRFILPANSAWLKEQVQTQLLSLLQRCGIDTNSVKLRTRARARTSATKERKSRARRHSFTHPTRTLSDAVELHFSADHTLPFARHIGFRYSAIKQQRLTAAVAYYRASQYVHEQKQWLIQRMTELNATESAPTRSTSIPVLLTRAKRDLAARQVIHPQVRDWMPSESRWRRMEGGKPNPTPLDSALHHWDLHKFFKADMTESAADRSVLPFFRVGLIGRRCVGVKAVYDLMVPGGGDDWDSFNANGLCAHNCSNAAQIWKKVSLGQKPEVLQRIMNKEVKSFIELCLMPAEMRPAARELLKHPFLRFKRSDPTHDDVCVAVEPRQQMPPHREPTEAALNKAEMKEAREREKERGRERERDMHAAHPPRDRAHRYNASMIDADHLLSPNARAGLPAGIGIGLSPSPTPTAAQPHPPHSPHMQQSPSPAHAHPPPGKPHGAHGRQIVIAPADHTPHGRDQYDASAHLYSAAAHTPPARISRTPSNNNLTAQPHPGLPHSQSLHTVSSLQQPHPQRPHAYPITPSAGGHAHAHGHAHDRHGHPPVGSPELTHVASVVVEVESTHEHYADIALHIHFEGGTRKKKMIRFVFDFHSDTCESVANEMVRALKLPHQERTARLIASTMEAKISPLRQQYYADGERAVEGVAKRQPSATPPSAPHAATPSPSIARAHDAPQHPPPVRSPSPHLSPPSRKSNMPRVPSKESLQYDQSERALPPHPPQNVQSVGRAAHPAGFSPHYQTMPAITPPTTTTGQIGKGAAGAGIGAAAGAHHLTPKHGSVQTSNVGPPRPGTGASKASRTMPSRDTASIALASRTPREPPSNVSKDTLSLTPMQRASSVTLSMLPAQRTNSLPHHQPAMPATAAQYNNNTHQSTSTSHIRRSSSTSSIAAMNKETDEEDVKQQMHDRLYDEYKLLSIPALKERIRERMKQRLQEGHSEGDNEPVELSGILEKSDLIESLIRLTPQNKNRSLTHHAASPPRATSPRESSAPPVAHARPHRHERSDSIVSDVSQPPSDSSSTQSTPRLYSGASADQPSAYAQQQRSRTQSIDQDEQALLGSFALPRPSSTTTRPPSLDQPIHIHARPPSHAGHRSPTSSPKAISPTESSAARTFPHQRGEGIPGPSPLSRGGSYELSMQEQRRLAQKGVSSKEGSAPHSRQATPAGVTGESRFSYAPTSGATSPSSTNSTLSHASSMTGASQDMDELYHTPTFNSGLHVDVGALTPPSSGHPDTRSLSPAGSAANAAAASASARAASQPTTTSANTSASNAPTSSTVPMSHAPPHGHLAPQSPTIPEEPDAEDGQASNAMSRSAYEAMRDAGHPLGSPVSDVGVSGAHGSAVSHPRRPAAIQHPTASSSMDELSRLMNYSLPLPSPSNMRKSPASAPHQPHTHQPTNTHTRNTSHMEHSTRSGTASSSAAGAVSSTSSTPSSASATSAPARTTNPAHHRAATMYVSGSSSASSSASPIGQDELESEEKRRIRKENAEREREQKKRDAATAAKLCEDRIMNGIGQLDFSLH